MLNKQIAEGECRGNTCSGLLLPSILILYAVVDIFSMTGYGPCHLARLEEEVGTVELERGRQPGSSAFLSYHLAMSFFESLSCSWASCLVMAILS